MTASRPTSKRRKVVKLSLVTLGVLILALVGLHIWFVNNARGILKQIVSEKSNGKIKIELSQFSLDIFSNKLQIREADLVSTDSTNQAVTYRVKFRKLTLRVHSFWPLLFEKKLLLDSIKLHEPEIEVTQWRRDTVSKRHGEELSVPQEMGKLYNSMLDGLDAFGIRRIIINNATLRMINKIDPAAQPVVVSNIYFDLWRSGDNSRKRDAYVENEQNVELRTDHQVIDLPGGRHRLSFKNFNLQLFRKRVELDSCTITARTTDSSHSNYRIFFDKLLLIGVDFDAMYRYNMIRADSVYCEKPFFNINVDAPQNTAATEKKTRPDFEKLVRELTGDLDLAFVGVKEAGIHINISSGARSRSLFNSSKDNFEMRGFRINSDSSQPVAVQRFDMLVRDYHLYNDDSSTAYTFDSIHFLNNKVVLNNFTVSTASDRFKERDWRDFKIPYFELTGLDWYELVFNENLNAEEATMYDPEINFRKNPLSVAQRKVSFFGALQTMDSLMTLRKVRIINGQLNLDLGRGTSVVLHDLDLSLYSNSLMKSTNREGLRKAVESLSFTRGDFKFKDILATMENIRFTGSNLLRADRLFVRSTTGKVRADAHDVYIDNLIVDDKNQSLTMDGLRWRNAVLTLHPGARSEAKKGSGHLLLNHINGANTEFHLVNGATSFSGFFPSIAVASVRREGAAPMQVNGLRVTAQRLSLKNPTMSARADAALISDAGDSYLDGVMVDQVRGRDSLHIAAPRIGFAPDVNALISGDLHLPTIEARSPTVRIAKWNAPVTTTQSGQHPLRIDLVRAVTPDIDMTIHRNDSVTALRIPYDSNGLLEATGIQTDGRDVSLASLTIKSSGGALVKPTGETIGVPHGRIDLALSDVHFDHTPGKPAWSFLVSRLKLEHPESFYLGRNRNKLSLEQAELGNFQLSSSSIMNINQLIRANISASLHSATGSYVDSTVTLKWYNASYQSGKKTFRLDSFSYYPTQPQDSMVMHTPYQIDYIRFDAGPIAMTDFDLDRYEADSAFVVNTIDISQPVMTIFRDKLPPVKTGIIRQLPTGMIKTVPFPLFVNRIRFTDGLLSYTEKNRRTRAEGTLQLKRMNGELSHIRNQALTADDSLSLSLNAYLMDSAYVELHVKESYTDTLSSFLMTLRMRPTSLSFLNPVLAPLSNVKITSGVIDSFHMRVIGRDDVAYGKMNMYYRGLRIKLVKGGNQNRSTFLDNVVSALVNTFFVRKNNNGRTGLVYYVRLRDRSFFNYIIKTTFSGIATSVGAKKNGRVKKRYQRALGKGTLPEMNIE